MTEITLHISHRPHARYMNSYSHAPSFGHQDNIRRRVCITCLSLYNFLKLNALSAVCLSLHSMECLHLYVRVEVNSRLMRCTQDRSQPSVHYSFLITCMRTKFPVPYNSPWCHHPNNSLFSEWCQVWKFSLIVSKHVTSSKASLSVWLNLRLWSEEQASRYEG
jgi:hypothetical protein